MSPLIETAGVTLLALAGVALGRWFARRPAPWWFLGYLLPLAIITLIGLAHRFRPLELLAPFSWLMAGRTEFAVFALVSTMVLTVPLVKLSRPRERAAVGVLAILMVAQVSILPFLAPAFIQAKLKSLVTQIDSDGVCRQNTDYTCGPAAAVTLLRRMGWSAEEGELAQFCRTSPAMGTPPDVLASRLQSRFGHEGLKTDYRAFHSVRELADAGPTLALVKFSFLLDHYVAVLEVNNTTITVGDPLTGKTTLTHEEFDRRWRHVGVVFSKSLKP
jgi:hypothetical protein